MPFARVNDLNLAYYIVGGGPPLLLIQGLGGRATDWGRVPATLGARFAVISFDNRGTGSSDKPTSGYSLEVMADEAVSVLRAAGHERAHVLGLSMGGMIAQLVALRQPVAVDKLILLSTSSGGSHAVQPTPAALQALMPDLSLPPDEIIRRSSAAITAPGFATAQPDVLQEIVSTALAAPTPPYAFALQMGAIMASDRYDDLPKIQAPTLVVHGDADPLVPLANGRILAERIPGARLATLRGCGHLAMWEQPDELCRIVLEFLG